MHSKNDEGGSLDFCSKHFFNGTEVEAKSSETAYYVTFMKRDMINQGVYAIRKKSVELDIFEKDYRQRMG